MMLPQMTDEMRVDLWWNAARKTMRYPSLVKVALHALCPFHGSQVESSFTMMANITQAKTTSLSVETYEACEVVKYELKAMEVSAISHLSRPLKDSPSTRRLYRMTNSRAEGTEQRTNERQNSMLPI
ncbi:hypothetical protein GJAV_G00086820 [Gymnothorax javanicus]|nr:hypothetical protein GJAV_G00086820 [Gymnothorax javanicus]